MRACTPLIAAFLLLLALAGCAGPSDSGRDRPGAPPVRPEAADQRPASGRVTLKIARGAFLLSATGGSGTLVFQGKEHGFKLGGAGVGGLGANVATAEGEVYNLNALEDFAGAYFTLEGGHAVWKGEGVLWLRNAKGVTLELRSSTTGLMMTVGAEGLVIMMDGR